MAGLCLLLVVGAVGCARHQATVAARSEKAERLSVQARQARDRGDFKKAEKLLTEAVERSPNDYEMRLELAELLLKHRNALLAEDHLRWLLDKNPEDPRVYAGLAEVRYLRRNLGDAEELVSQALDLDPRLESGLLLRARIEEARGNTGHALDDLYQILDTEGPHCEARLLVAQLHLRRGDSRLAASEMRALLELPNLDHETQSQAQWLLGNCYCKDERWSEAAVALAAGIPSRGGDARDWLHLAEVSRRAGDLPGAKRAVDKALAESPQDHQALALAETIAADSTVSRAGHTALREKGEEEKVESR